MTAYYSNKWNLNRDGVNTVQPIYNATGDFSVLGVFAQTTALVANDIVHMVTIPPNCIVTDMALDIDAMDSSTGFTGSVGDGVNGGGAWIAVQNMGQNSAGSVVPAPNVPGFLGYGPFTNPTDITFKCNHAATTPLTTGSIRLRVTCSSVY